MRREPKVAVVLLIGLVLVVGGLRAVKAGAAPAPKPEGTLTVGLYTLGEEGFLPDRCTNSANPLWECVYDYLIYSDHNTRKPIPGVAERWEYSKDFRTLTFYLRKGIQFQGGWGELTAEDVKASIELNARPTSTNLRSSELRKIKSMEVVDPYTLVLQLKEPSPMLWASFCTADNCSLPVLCKKYIESVGEEKANRQPVGSGPYRLVEQRMGDYAKFEAVEKHWLVVPEFKYMILRVVPEETTRVAMLKTGELDIAFGLSVNNVPEVEKVGLKAVMIPGSTGIFYPFGGMLLPEDKRYVEGYHRKDPWKDIRVREAMNLAIDRASIVKNLFGGLAVSAPIGLLIPGWDKQAPIPYDPKRAKQLLVEAGYPNGFGFKFFTHAKRPDNTIVADAVAGYWEAIGLKAEIVRGDYATWRDTNKTGKTAGWLWTHSLDATADWTGRLGEYESPGASTPLWQSEETKAAIKKVQAELDSTRREALFQELARVYRSVYAHVPVVVIPKVHGVGKQVGEWYSTPRDDPKGFIFARHAVPLNTYRLFTP